MPEIIKVISVQEKIKILGKLISYEKIGCRKEGKND